MAYYTKIAHWIVCLARHKRPLKTILPLFCLPCYLATLLASRFLSLPMQKWWKSLVGHIKVANKTTAIERRKVHSAAFVHCFSYTHCIKSGFEIGLAWWMRKWDRRDKLCHIQSSLHYTVYWYSGSGFILTVCTGMNGKKRRERTCRCRAAAEPLLAVCMHFFGLLFGYWAQLRNKALTISACNTNRGISLLAASSPSLIRPLQASSLSASFSSRPTFDIIAFLTFSLLSLLPLYGSSLFIYIFLFSVFSFFHPSLLTASALYLFIIL